MVKVKCSVFAAIIFNTTKQQQQNVVALSDIVNNKNSTIERQTDTCRNMQHVAVQTKDNKQKAIGVQL